MGAVAGSGPASATRLQGTISQIPGKTPYIAQNFSNPSALHMSRRARRSPLTDVNRLQRAPPQPFRARVARNFQPASNQVFCESSPHYQPGAPARWDDRTKDRALRISPTEDRQLRRLLRQIHARNVSLRSPLRNRRLSGAAALTTSPARNLWHGPNLFGSPGFRGQDYRRDFERSARPRVRSCASRNFPRGVATHGCKEYHCKQTVRAIVDKPAPIALRTLWSNRSVAMPVSSHVDSGISKLRPTWLCPAR